MLWALVSFVKKMAGLCDTRIFGRLRPARQPPTLQHKLQALHHLHQLLELLNKLRLLAGQGAVCYVMETGIFDQGSIEAIETRNAGIWNGVRVEETLLASVSEH